MASRGLWLALSVALVVRAGMLGAALAASPSPLADDPDVYVQIARNVVERGLYGIEPPHLLPRIAGVVIPPPEATAIRTPLYPLVLSGCVALAKVTFPGHVATASLWLIAALHLACGLATVWLTWTLAGRWGVSQLAAALLVACDPLLVHQSTLVMTETLAALLAILWLTAMTGMDDAVHNQASSVRAVLIAGIVTGLAALCRPTFLPLAGVATAALVSWAFTGRRSWRNAMVYLLAVTAVLAPWVLRNQWQFGRPIVATTHGGYTLLLGNNELYYRHVRTTPDAAFDGNDIGVYYFFTKGGLDQQRREGKLEVPAEIAADRLASDEAWRAIQADPQGFLLATLVRWQSLWRLVPLQTDPNESAARRTLRYATGAWYGLEFALAAVGLVAVGSGCWKGSWRWGLLLVLVFVAVHTLYWTDMRMRAPLMPFIALAASAGWDRLRQALGRQAAAEPMVGPAPENPASSA